MTPETVAKREQQMEMVEGMRNAVRAIRKRIPMGPDAWGLNVSERVAVEAMRTVMTAVEEGLSEAALDLFRFGPLTRLDDPQEWFESRLLTALKNTAVPGLVPVS